MGDGYRPAPRRGGAEYDRDERYDFHYERGGRYAPLDRDGYYPPPYQQSYPTSPPRDRDRDYGRSEASFTFRGAADRDRFQPRRPEETFSFRAVNHPAPRFRSRSPIPRERSPRPQKHRAQPAGQFRNNGMNGLRGDRRQGGRGRGGRFNPAYNRDILRQRQRGSTPEQLAGMNINGQPRFKDVNGVDVKDDGVVDLTPDAAIDHTHSTDDQDSNEAPRKRAKVEPPPAEVAAPKWSNPDPYTSLPPPNTFGGPKVDVVQLIRKAKVDVDPSSKKDAENAVKNNVDFVSLNEEASEEGEASDDSATSPRRSSPPPPSSFRPIPLSKAKQKSSTSQPAPSKRSRFELLSDDDDIIGSPPPPPRGLVMPSHEELAAVHAGESRGNTGKGRKRKLGEQSRDVGSILPEWDANGSNPTPWFFPSVSTTAIPTLQKLDKEILDFYHFVRPYSHENEVRMDLVHRIERAVRGSGLPHAHSVSVNIFGSFASGLYLPIGDMDLVAISENYRARGHKTFCQSTNNMRRLGQHLEMSGIAAPGTITWIGKARVPLVKFTDRTTGIKVDISFENATGLTAISTVQRWRENHPEMPMLVLFIKQLLAMRGLNEVFTGGLGGFSIICLVVSMLQISPKVKLIRTDSEDYYARLLLEFFDLYGNRFDIFRHGIRMSPPEYFDKIRNPASKQNANRLTIIDPNNDQNDVSGGTSNIRAVLDVFRSALLSIERRLVQIDAAKGSDGGSILGCILGAKYDVFIRQRDRMSDLHRGLDFSSPSPPPSPPPRSVPSRPPPKRKVNQQPEPTQSNNHQRRLQKWKEGQGNGLPSRGGRGPRRP